MKAVYLKKSPAYDNLVVSRSNQFLRIQASYCFRAFPSQDLWSFNCTILVLYARQSTNWRSLLVSSAVKSWNPSIEEFSIDGVLIVVILRMTHGSKQMRHLLEEGKYVDKKRKIYQMNPVDYVIITTGRKLKNWNWAVHSENCQKVQDLL